MQLISTSIPDLKFSKTSDKRFAVFNVHGVYYRNKKIGLIFKKHKGFAHPSGQSSTDDLLWKYLANESEYLPSIGFSTMKEAAEQLFWELLL